MRIDETLKSRWLWYSIFCLLVWGPYQIVSNLGSKEIPALTMQYLFTWGALPVLLGLLIVRGFKLEKDVLGIFHATFTGVLSGLGGIGLFAAYAASKSVTVVATATSLYPMITVVLALVFLRERLSQQQIAGLVFAMIALALFGYGSA